MNEQEIEQRIAALLDEHVIYNEKPAAELRRLYTIEQRYAPTDGDERSTEELLAECDDVTLHCPIHDRRGGWQCVIGASPSPVWGRAPTARAALIEALKERGE